MKEFKVSNKCVRPLSVTNNTGEGIDLELELIAPNSFNIYTYILFQARVTNTATVNAENVEVDFPLPNGFVHSSNMASHGNYSLFNERWNIGTIKVNETAVLDLTLFALTTATTTAYAQVSNAEPDDIDSTPGNGTCCIPNEDDEDAVTISSNLQNGSGTSTLIAPNIHTNMEIKAIYPNLVVDEMTVFVQSNLSELQLRVYDLQGNEVLDQIYTYTEGFQRLPLNVAELPTGTYILRFDGSLGRINIVGSSLDMQN